MMERSDRIALMAATLYAAKSEFITMEDAAYDAASLDDFVQEKYAPPPPPEEAPPLEEKDTRECSICGGRNGFGTRLYNVIANNTGYKLEVRCKTHLNHWRRD